MSPQLPPRDFYIFHLQRFQSFVDMAIPKFLEAEIAIIRMPLPQPSKVWALFWHPSLRPTAPLWSWPTSLALWSWFLHTKQQHDLRRGVLKLGQTATVIRTAGHIALISFLLAHISCLLTFYCLYNLYNLNLNI